MTVRMTSRIGEQSTEVENQSTDVENQSTDVENQSTDVEKYPRRRSTADRLLMWVASSRCWQRGDAIYCFTACLYVTTLRGCGDVETNQRHTLHSSRTQFIDLHVVHSVSSVFS